MSRKRAERKQTGNTKNMASGFAFSHVQPVVCNLLPANRPTPQLNLAYGEDDMKSNRTDDLYVSG